MEEKHDIVTPVFKRQIARNNLNEFSDVGQARRSRLVYAN